MKLSALALISLASLSAQPFPDAVQLLDYSSSPLKSHRTVQYTTEMTMEMAVMGSPVKMTTTTLYQSLAPDKFRMESKTAGMDSLTIIVDGQYMWTYIPLMKQYTKTKIGADLPADQLFGDLGLSAMAQGPEMAKSAKVARSEVLEVDGQPHDCWVIENQLPKISVPTQPGGALQDAVYTFWIDKQLGLPLRTVMSGKVQAGPALPSTDMKMTTTLGTLKFDEDLAESLFVFTPPAGAKETADMLPGIPAGPPQKSSLPVQKQPLEKPAEIPAGEPQAFVPNLTPTTRTEPDYPVSARDHGVQGSVHLLITVDPAGYAATVETLSGPDQLKKSAEDAARHWRFRPVLRNGQPVYAFTDAFVSFGQGLGDPDLAEEMAEARRIAELQNRMPRSPQQVLEDLEQDHAGASGFERTFALPGLAKAALEAGALDKAASYANEMLASDSKSPNHGQAIHDGNMIRGLVTLRQGNVTQAAHDLVEAGKTSGSPVLNSFGPNVTLAKELLEKGERDAVLEYFSLCRSFWKMGVGKLDAWSATVRNGGVPDFGPNLVY